MGVLTVDFHAIEVACHIAGTEEAPASAASDGTSTSAWFLLAVALLGSSVLAGLITSALASLRAAATARREGYANAVRLLIARREYPYRVRRRVSDEPGVLSALTNQGHDLQEQIAASRTWVASEHRVIGTMFEEALAAIDATVKQATSDAWNKAPITTAAGMNLNGWGPDDASPHVRRLQRGIGYRFGWRRVVPSFWWRGLR